MIYLIKLKTMFTESVELDELVVLEALIVFLLLLKIQGLHQIWSRYEIVLVII